MATQTETRPPIAIGHITLQVTAVAQATEHFVALALPHSSIGDLYRPGAARGTHLVLRLSDESIPAQKAPFDLMVDDVVATRQAYLDKGLRPSEIESGTIHRWFTLVGPDAYKFTITSSHAGKRAV